MLKRGLVAGVLVAAVGGAVVLAQQPAGSKPQPTPKPAERVQPPVKSVQPADPASKPQRVMDGPDQEMTGPEHAQLAKLAGDWTVATTMEMGTMKMKSSGTASFKAALGGRFLHQTETGEMQGQKTETFKVWGYNSDSHKFESVWTWTMNNSLLHLTGDSTDGGKTIDWAVWYQKSPTEKEEFKATTTMPDTDHFTVKLFGGKMPDGSPGPVMTSTYTRKK
jgi:hypothetical protein